MTLNEKISWQRLLEIWASVDNVLNKSVLAEANIGSDALGLQQDQALVSSTLQKKSDQDSDALNKHIREVTTQTQYVTSAMNGVIIVGMNAGPSRSNILIQVADLIAGVTNIIQGALMLGFAKDMEGISKTDLKAGNSKAILDLAASFYRVVSKREEESLKTTADQADQSNQLINNIYDALKEASRKI